MERSSAMDSWIEQFVEFAATDDEAQKFVDVIDGAILATNPSIAADPVLVEDLHRSTRAQWRAFLAGLSRPAHRLVLPEPATEFARSMARRGMQLPVLLKVYRSAHQGVFRFITEMTAASPSDAPSRDQILALIWGRVDSWLDDSIEMLIESFYAERTVLDAGVAVRRTQTIDALLARTTHIDDDAASKVLGYSLRHWQTGIVVWTQQSAPIQALIQVTEALAHALEGPPPLTHVAGSRDLWAWVATPSTPDLSRLTSIADSAAKDGIRVSVGIPALGSEGFRTSHLEARAVHNLTVSAVHVPPFVRFDEVELLCMAMESRELLERMVWREAAQLCGVDKSLALIRETALVYLTNGQRIDETAEVLFVHKNTVRYRLARAADLLGHPLTERLTHIELALRYLDLFGPELPELEPRR